jgi:hypothetical protein
MRTVSCLEPEPATRPSSRATYTMVNDDKPQKGRAGAPVRAKMTPQTERPFDMWLEKQLHAMYDEIASEPLPEDLLSLIERDAAKKNRVDRGKKK